MKKIIIAACLMLGFAGMATAQKVEKKAAPAKEAKMEKTPVAKEAKMEKAAVAATPAVGPKKADGTPDKRFKENKANAAAPAGPVKKDGTPDKRYNANKKG